MKPFLSCQRRTYATSVHEIISLFNICQFNYNFLSTFLTDIVSLSKGHNVDEIHPK